jgi:hypothetical protein
VCGRRTLAQDRVGLFGDVFDLHTGHSAIMALEAPFHNRAVTGWIRRSAGASWTLVTAGSGGPDLGLAAVGERRRVVAGLPPAPCWFRVARWDARFPGSATVEFLEVLAGQAVIRRPGRAGWPVQQESTATGADLAGLVCTLWGLALVSVRGAFGSVTLAAVARGQANSAFAGPSSCRRACRPTGCAGRAGHGGKARMQRAAAR